MNYYPDVGTVLSRFDNAKDKDQILFETRRSWLSILSNMLLFFLATIAVILLNLFLPNANILGYFTSAYKISVRWLAFVPALLLLEVLRRYHNDLYRFTAHHLTHFGGRLSLSYSVPNIRYVDIRAVIVFQDIWGRIFNYGDLEVDTAAQEITEMRLCGVRAPEELAELIEALRTRSKKTFKPQEGDAGPASVSED